MPCLAGVAPGEPFEVLAPSPEADGRSHDDGQHRDRKHERPHPGSYGPSHGRDPLRGPSPKGPFSALPAMVTESRSKGPESRSLASACLDGARPPNSGTGGPGRPRREGRAEALRRRAAGRHLFAAQAVEAWRSQADPFRPVEPAPADGATTSWPTAAGHPPAPHRPAPRGGVGRGVWNRGVAAVEPRVRETPAGGGRS